MALLKSVATVGGLTGVSRVLGLVRDVLIAQAVGTQAVADAFFVAFRIPNLFRRMFAEGAFNAAFVPLYARRLEHDGADEANAFAAEALSVLTAFLLLLTAVAVAAMPWLMHVLAPGFVSDSEKFDLTVELTRVTFPYLLFISLTALLSGVLNSYYRFAAAAAAPILLNVFFIVTLVLVLPFTEAPGPVMAWTVAAAGVGQFVFLLIACRRAGIRIPLRRPRVTPGVRRLVQLMVPGLLSAGVLQINLVVGTIIASQQAGAVSYLYYADRLYQLPLGLIGIAIGVVLLPELSRKLRAGAHDVAEAQLNRGLELSLLLTLPATIALMVIPEPIVIVLYERGALSREASQAIAWAVVAFAAGLPSFVLVKILQPAFYAREDTVTPLKLASVSVAVNVAGSLALFPVMGHTGIAVATSLAGWVNCVGLALILARRGFFAFDQRFKARFPRIMAAALLMGAVVWGLGLWLEPWMDRAFLLRLAALAILVVSGLLGFAVAALSLGATDRAEFTGLFKRKRQSDGSEPEA